MGAGIFTGDVPEDDAAPLVPFAIIVIQEGRQTKSGYVVPLTDSLAGAEGEDLMSSTVGEPAPATPLPGVVGLGVLLEAMPGALVGVDRAGVWASVIV